MNQSIPFAPPRAATSAGEVDTLFLIELAVSLFFIALIFICIAYFAIRYRRRSEDEVPPFVGTHYGIEATWTLVPLAIVIVFFFLGARLYVNLKRPLPNALEIHVIGKQWMWKIQHPGGVREIDELHVPINRPIRLIMASQDVIHDLAIPAFRIRQDVVPGSYVTQWFVATRPGTYHFFCSQYCGTSHSKMVGSVIAMEPADYQAWLAGSAAATPPAASGEKLFMSLGCAQCHGQRAPTLAGLYGSRVVLQNGSTVTADENYLRQSILDPSAQIVAGYPAIMPSFRGQISEEQLFDLVSYIKSLAPVRNVSPATVPAPPPLEGPSTRPAPGDQPGGVSNFPPAESTGPLSPSPGSIRR